MFTGGKPVGEGYIRLHTGEVNRSGWRRLVFEEAYSMVVISTPSPRPNSGGRQVTVTREIEKWPGKKKVNNVSESVSFPPLARYNTV